MLLLHLFRPFLDFKAHVGFFRNGDKIKRSEKVKAIAYLKRRIRSSIGRSLIVGSLGMRELDVPIPLTLTHHIP